ncbi:hypothetical protein CUMW_175990 [Citrus unshiu]|uniref:WHEP-TRS domain-containing protein n=1 Tax=Citrus unshiu TaxID=55188 RepID=A0A2H5PX96_CITUN|nr:hypothetical protein CUMW_175990 [Citrus unshiu]
MRTFSTIIASSTPIGRYLISRLSLRRSHAISVKPQASTPPMAAADASNEESLRRTLAEKQSAVDAQGNAVRALKAAKASKSEIDAAIESLNRLKLEKSSVERELQSVVSGSGGGASVNREAFRQTVFNTLERRLFFIPSFKIYRGVAGLYDYGPPGCAVKSNVLAFWRQHFVLEEDMLEVDCPCVTPEAVLKASGHVEKFTDLMVKDEKMGTCYRADHLLKDFGNEKLEKDLSLSAEKAAELRHLLAVLDDLSAEELGAKIKEYGITAPDTKNPLSDPYPFNLMFQTSIGPSGLIPGYMRPETAQGIFVNFKDLYYYNGNKLPFAAAQIGQAFRNEHFVDPQDKSHAKFSEVANLEFLMFPREEQMSGKSAKRIPLGEAVSKGTSIGKRYARTDELGVPFAITVDSTSSVTIRERDSKDQIRVSLDEAASVIKAVTDGQTKWEDVWSSYPHHSSESADD